MARPFKPRVYTDAQLALTWFWFLAVLGLATRLSLLANNVTENTDGILNLTYFSPDRVPTPRFVLLPGYPFLVWAGQRLGLDGVLWGRGLASLFGLLFLFPLWKLARRWVSVEMAGMVCLMALLSPLVWQWSLRVMADTLLLLCFWACLERLIAAYLDQEEKAWVAACLWGAGAALARPEGFLLLPWIAGLGWHLRGRLAVKNLLLTLLVWSLPFLFLGPHLMTLLQAYQEGLGLGPGGVHPLANAAEHLYAYLTQPAFVFTPILFLTGLAGLWHMALLKSPAGRAWRRLLLPLGALLFLTRLFPTAYQDRYLMLFLPFFLVGSGYEMETLYLEWRKKRGTLPALFLKNGLLAAGLAYQAFFSMVAIAYQTDSFGDLRRSGEFLKTLPAGAVIYSDEVPKTHYWAGREIQPQVLPFRPRPGDYLVLHSFYTPRLGFVDRTLRDKFGAEVVYANFSSVVPLLTDLMADPAVQNRVAATGFRFQTQTFESVVYRIGRPGDIP
ncbi:MAG TPA: glycosyltransferase family 39 protein [bacterium]|nr:glycosyltransferase family 39 protein [bacterium]